MITIQQGVTETITLPDLKDANDNTLDPSGWAILAYARHWGPDGPIVATWRDDPGEGEMLAEVTGDAGSKVIVLHVDPLTSAEWTWFRGVIQCSITEPTGELRQARMADETIVVSPSITLEA